jgi:hypothetical protein
MSAMKKIRMVLGVVMLFLGIAVIFDLVAGFWGLHSGNPSNPFTPLVWSILKTVVLAFAGGTALVGGTWAVASAMSRKTQPQVKL